MKNVKLFCTAALAAAITACSPAGDGPAKTNGAETNGAETETAQTETTTAAFILADTNWQLIQITSGDEAPIDVEAGLYTLAIDADGTAAMRLDCNRGTGPWEGASGEDVNAGSFAFGAIGMTRRMCMPGSISDRVAADLARIDAFKSGDQALMLTGDDGQLIYSWETLDIVEEGPAGATDPASTQGE